MDIIIIIIITDIIYISSHISNHITFCCWFRFWSLKRRKRMISKIHTYTHTQYNKSMDQLFTTYHHHHIYGWFEHHIGSIFNILLLLSIIWNDQTDGSDRINIDGNWSRSIGLWNELNWRDNVLYFFFVSFCFHFCCCCCLLAASGHGGFFLM